MTESPSRPPSTPDGRRIHPVVAAVLTFWAVNSLIWTYVAVIVLARAMMGAGGSTPGG